VSWITKRRKRLVRKAHGDVVCVVEVFVGQKGGSFLDELHALMCSCGDSSAMRETFCHLYETNIHHQVFYEDGHRLLSTRYHCFECCC
jgi:hypothetical protein